MENQKQKQQNDATATKKESGPTYGDKPWQTPQENDRKDSESGDSCGCGSDSEKTNKKEQVKNR